VSHVQLTSRYAGAEGEHSRAASRDWPTEIFHAVDVMISLLMGVGQEAGMILFFPWI